MCKTSQASCPGGVTTEGAQFRSEIQLLQQRCGACGCLEEVALFEGLVLVVAEGGYPNATPNSVASPVDLQTRIFALRGLSVLLDSDLVLLYGASTKALLQAVRRNPDCFPMTSCFSVQIKNLAF